MGNIQTVAVVRVLNTVKEVEGARKRRKVEGRQSLGYELMLLRRSALVLGYSRMQDRIMHFLHYVIY